MQIHGAVRRLVFSLIALLSATSASALDTPLMGGGTTVPSTSATNYTAFGNSFYWVGTENDSRNIIPTAGTFRTLYIKLAFATNAGTGWVFTLVKNGSDQALSCSISNGATTCNDTTNSFSVAAGDTVSIKAEPTNSPAAINNIQIGVVFRSTASGESIVVGTTRNSNVSSISTQYVSLQGANAPNNTITNRDAPIPTAGTIDKLYVEQAAASGSGSAFKYTLFKNGVATALTCNISDLVKTCSNTADEIAVTSNDLVVLQTITHTGTPTGSFARWGVRWRPSTPGETILLKNDAAAPNSSAVRYSSPAGGSQAWNTAETGTQLILPSAFNWKKWTIVLNNSNSPGTYTFRSRKNTANGNQLITITAGTAGSDAVNTDTLAAGDLISAWSQGSSSPTSAITKWGWVLSDPNEVVPTPVPTATAASRRTRGMLGVGR